MPHKSPKRLSNDGVFSPWISSSGTIAHPSSPSGGCGPGDSCIPCPLGSDGNDANPIAHPESPVGCRITLTKKDALSIRGTTLANDPPETRTDIFDIKREQTQRTDILVKGKVLSDGRDPNLGKSAITRLDPSGLVAQYPRPYIERNMVTKEEGKFTLKGTVTIQIIYDTNGYPKDPARYGRGTTERDINNGDITAGFHESCHLADYVDWLKTKPLPVFKTNLPISKNAYEKACDQFDKDLDKYFEEAEHFSEENTDEVGRKKSQVSP